jgi:hypothetical protein
MPNASLLRRICRDPTSNFGWGSWEISQLLDFPPTIPVLKVVHYRWITH